MSIARTKLASEEKVVVICNGLVKKTKNYSEKRLFLYYNNCHVTKPSRRCMHLPKHFRLILAVFSGNHSLCENSCKPRQKCHLNSQKKITHIDDMMIHNLAKYLIQTQLCLWDIKIINFKPTSCPDDLLEIYYFYISQKKSSLDKIFCKIVYHHIIYMCDFFREFRWLFCHGLHEFLWKFSFHQIYCH